jgi:hypothetical protein
MLFLKELGHSNHSLASPYQKFKVILEKIDDLEFHKKKEKVHTFFQDLSNSE